MTEVVGPSTLEEERFMRAKHQLIIAAPVSLATLLAAGVSLAQQAPGRTREPTPAVGATLAPAMEAADRGTERPGGIPRNRAAERTTKTQQDGTEEGAPDTSVQPQLKELGPRFAPPRTDWKIGVWTYNTESGVIISRVLPGSPAARQGLERGDKIVAVGGYQVGFVGDLLFPLGYEIQRQVDRRGDVLLLVQNVRNKELQSVTLNLGRSRNDRPGSFPVEPRY